MPTKPEDIYQTGEYARKNPTYHVEDAAWKAQQILMMMRKNALDPRSVCEVGCGAGEILRQLHAQMPETEFVGYEVSPQAFALCQKRETDRLHFYLGDLAAGATRQFDLLLCIDVFEHVEDYFGFLRALRGRAKRTIFHIPLDVSVQSVLRRRPILLEREQAGHLHYFTKETALATLRDCGYEIRDLFYTPGAIANPRSTAARLAAWPRRLLSAIDADITVRILGGYSLLVLTE